MRDPYAPPSTQPEPESAARNHPKRPASVTWAMVLCIFWLSVSYLQFKRSQQNGSFDYLLAIIIATVLFAITISFAIPRSKLRQRALAAVYVITLLRVAQTILMMAKYTPASITPSRVIFWLIFTGLLIWGILRVLTGPAAGRYFEPDH
ncbi:MAG: 4-amino-4-deoxy-L-arabinose transferase-like glycosyltransferase [Verrucomicrobiales bacterium]|jgi:4-amino-4-deoxy-L-arabinose transferase-like glycosyltransferase